MNQDIWDLKYLDEVQSIPFRPHICLLDLQLLHHLWKNQLLFMRTAGQGF